MTVPKSLCNGCALATLRVIRPQAFDFATRTVVVQEPMLQAWCMAVEGHAVIIGTPVEACEDYEAHSSTEEGRIKALKAQQKDSKSLVEV